MERNVNKCRPEKALEGLIEQVNLAMQMTGDNRYMDVMRLLVSMRSPETVKAMEFVKGLAHG